MLTSLKYKLGCGRELATLRQHVVNVCSAGKRAHLKLITQPLTVTEYMSDTHKHTPHRHNSVKSPVQKVSLVQLRASVCWQNAFWPRTCCTLVFSRALTHKHAQDWANKKLLDSLQVGQTSQGVISPGMYIVAVHQVFLEFAVCTKKSHGSSPPLDSALPVVFVQKHFLWTWITAVVFALTADTFSFALLFHIYSLAVSILQ